MKQEVMLILVCIAALVIILLTSSGRAFSKEIDYRSVDKMVGIHSATLYSILDDVCVSKYVSIGKDTIACSVRNDYTLFVSADGDYVIDAYIVNQSISGEAK